MNVGLWDFFNYSVKSLVADSTVNQWSVISEGTLGMICIYSSSATRGGFKVEVIVQKLYPKSCINVRLLQTFEEQKVLLDGGMGVDLLDGEFDSFPVGFWEFTKICLRFSRTESSTDQNQQQQNHSHDLRLTSRSESYFLLESS